MFFFFLSKVIMNNLWFGMSIRDAIQQPRIHAQWVPDNVFAETLMPKETVQALKRKGHNVSDCDRISSHREISEEVFSENDTSANSLALPIEHRYKITFTKERQINNRFIDLSNKKRI